MINFDDVTKENRKKRKPNRPQIFYYPNRILIIGGSRSRKTNALINSINHQPDIDKIHLYTKASYETKYKLLINKREGVGSKYCIDSKAFIKYLNDMGDIYENINEYNQNKKRKILTEVDDMIADMPSN